MKFLIKMDDECVNNTDDDGDDGGLDELEPRRINQTELDGYVYRGEGNANLVISLPSTRSVLRFRKIIRGSNVTVDDSKERCKFEIKYFHEFIRKFMNGFVGEPEIIFCPTEDLPDWNERVERLRPDCRRGGNIYEKLAIKVRDYSTLPGYLDNDLAMKPTFTIEIKPKQGFTHEGDRNVLCTYCLTQFYKQAEKLISQRSTFCPCDLFSGDKIRMKNSIIGLLNAPQNNLILFKNSTRVWGDGDTRDELNRLLTECLLLSSEENKLEDTLCHLLIEALLRPLFKTPTCNLSTDKICTLHDDNNKSSCEINVKTFPINKSCIKKCNFATGSLPQGSVLQRIYEMQKLHDTSSNKVYNIYKKNLNIQLNDVLFYNKQNDIQLLKNYSLFSTARDCSILLSFRKIDSCSLSKYPECNIIKAKNQEQEHNFIFNIGVTDLDPKSLERIEKHRRQTINSINALTSMSSSY